MQPHDQITALKQAIAQQYGLLDRDRGKLTRQLRSAAMRIVLLEASIKRLRKENMLLAIACILNLVAGVILGARLF